MQVRRVADGRRRSSDAPSRGGHRKSRAPKGWRRQTSTPPSLLVRFVFLQPVTHYAAAAAARLRLPVTPPPLAIAGVFLSCRVFTSTGLQLPPPSRSAWPPPPPRCPSDPQVLFPRSGFDPTPSCRRNRFSLVVIRLSERLVAPSPGNAAPREIALCSV
jgi:hypothetical protein